jgi:hypothetical protein
VEVVTLAARIGECSTDFLAFSIGSPAPAPGAARGSSSGLVGTSTENEGFCEKWRSHRRPHRRVPQLAEPRVLITVRTIGQTADLLDLLNRINASEQESLPAPEIKVSPTIKVAA